MKFKSINDLRAKMGLAAAEQAARKLVATDATPQPPRSKYGNVKVEADGEKYDSKLEYRICTRLRSQHGKAGVMRQVSVELASDSRMRPDFLIIYERYENGRFLGEFADAKGRVTEVWRAKANHFFEKYGLKIRLITE